MARHVTEPVGTGITATLTAGGGDPEKIPGNLKADADRDSDTSVKVDARTSAFSECEKVEPNEKHNH